MMDVAYMFSIYFVVFLLNYYNTLLYGNLLINTLTEWFIDIGSITNIILPLILFFISYIKKQTEFKRQNEY